MFKQRFIMTLILIPLVMGGILYAPPPNIYSSGMLNSSGNVL